MFSWFYRQGTQTLQTSRPTNTPTPTLTTNSPSLLDLSNEISTLNPSSTAVKAIVAMIHSHLQQSPGFYALQDDFTAEQAQNNTLFYVKTPSGYPPDRELNNITNSTETTEEGRKKYALAVSHLIKKVISENCGDPIERLNLFFDLLTEKRNENRTVMYDIVFYSTYTDPILLLSAILDEILKATVENPKQTFAYFLKFVEIMRLQYYKQKLSSSLASIATNYRRLDYIGPYLAIISKLLNSTDTNLSFLHDLRDILSPLKSNLNAFNKANTQSYFNLLKQLLIAGLNSESTAEEKAGWLEDFISDLSRKQSWSELGRYSDDDSIDIIVLNFLSVLIRSIENSSSTRNSLFNLSLERATDPAKNLIKLMLSFSLISPKSNYIKEYFNLLEKFINIKTEKNSDWFRYFMKSFCENNWDNLSPRYNEISPYFRFMSNFLDKLFENSLGDNKITDLEVFYDSMLNRPNQARLLRSIFENQDSTAGNKYLELVQKLSSILQRLPSSPACNALKQRIMRDLNDSNFIIIEETIGRTRQAIRTEVPCTLKEFVIHSRRANSDSIVMKLEEISQLLSNSQAMPPPKIVSRATA